MLVDSTGAYCNEFNTHSYIKTGMTLEASHYDYLWNTYIAPEITVDYTEILDNFMEEQADGLYLYKEQFGYIDACFAYHDSVTDGGSLDIKLQDEWQFRPGQIYLYRGMQLRYDDPGNICAGYVGKVLFYEEVLCFCAGLNQIKKYGFKYGNLATWFDDPRDQAMVRYGYSLNRW